ncbi:FAD-dependent monooxygenase [Allostreptomyces psammosilenae]|uniref:2-polyprenyl-6-methoxyphenol hydroxylase-like FAD-dependent oxidoreductase n=1 Tax=Allostreptomyces psammosilenae TaxID=1892865 RepID=A0A852ZSF4_9ACTN|nr:FAD-dependent monooxygenase [Allostreptomyces psammosilenae]NYI05366.1 2-polyprenyl-6-methoxyphenol hydroxylase-like FAD-dependent oxidoreductase [Allostreptomyces psammosilenae]
MTGSTAEVLVVGAGPTGLTLACTLLQHGVAVRVVERRKAPATAPKALILWTGALEVLDRLGVSERIREGSVPLNHASYWSKGRRIGQIGFDVLAGTRFPNPLSAPQTVTEAALLARLEELGGKVEWETKLTDLKKIGTEAVEAVLESADGTTERPTVGWVVAADGIHSEVRRAAGIAYEGDTYDREFILGDGVFDGSLPADEAQYHMTPDGVMVAVPLPGGGHRVFFDVAAGVSSDQPSMEQIQALMDARGPGGWTYREDWWRSRFRVHAKVAPNFRSGRVFVAGDAAHCHSPAGGQGLNTGVQDGFNLGWKLACVVRGGDESLLDSYDVERRPTSVAAIRMADMQTRMWLVRSPIGRTVRDTGMRVLSQSGLLAKRVVPTLAQYDLDLSSSPAVRDLRAGAPSGRAAAGRLRPGFRVPGLELRAVAGRSAESLHAYSASGRHTLLVVPAAGGGQDASAVAARLRERVSGTDYQDLVDVLLLVAPGTAAAGGDNPGYDVAEVAGGALPSGDVAEVAWVRPDGVVGACAAASDADRLVGLLPFVPSGEGAERTAA